MYEPITRCVRTDQANLRNDQACVRADRIVSTKRSGGMDKPIVSHSDDLRMRIIRYAGTLALRGWYQLHKFVSVAFPLIENALSFATVCQAKMIF